jgi:hypothetical protein
MEQSTLQEILGVEKEIREQLDAEREKASQWLENARREIEVAHRVEMERLREAAGAKGEATQRVAREKAAALVRSAEEAARAVARCTEDELKRRIAAGIAAILPGAARAR